MSRYTSTLRAHLGRYKEDCLGVAEQGMFNHKGRNLPYPHILPKDRPWLNILEPFREELKEYVEARPSLKLHRYFHHLNSSQAFALNLFYPYFEYGGSKTLLRATGLKGDVDGWMPEYVVDSEEQTNADVAWKDSAGQWTFCEVKLSEQDFGKAKNDERHRRKLREIYAPYLKSHVDPEFLVENRFFRSYQIFRNVWLAAREEGSLVVFLLPKANAALWPRLHDALSGLRPPLRSRIHVVAIETVLTTLAEDSDCPEQLVGYAGKLIEKYIPMESIASR